MDHPPVVSYAKMISAFTISTAAARILFIFPTHPIGSAAFKASVTPWAWLSGGEKALTGNAAGKGFLRVLSNRYHGMALKSRSPCAATGPGFQIFTPTRQMKVASKLFCIVVFAQFDSI